MARAVILLLVLLTKSLYSQEKPLEERISDDICSCFGEYGFTVLNEHVNVALDSCSTVAVKKYQTELERYFSSIKDSSYQQGYEAGKIYFQQKVAPLLFKECEVIKKLQIKKE